MTLYQGPKDRRPPAGRAPGVFVDEATGFRGWTQEIAGGRDVVTPCLDAGRLLLGGGFGSHEFYAFDARTGALLWARRTRDDGPTAAVASDGYVVFNTESCTVCVLRADTGDTVWERWLGDPLLAQPAVGAGKVFMAWPEHGDHRLGAFDLATGHPLWNVPLAADVITAPVFAEESLYLSSFEGGVHCFDAGQGKRLWSRFLRATSAPWVCEGEVFVSHREDREGARGEGPVETVGAADAGFYRKMGASRRADYLRSRRGTAAGRLDLEKDGAVGFGAAPAAAKLGLAEATLGATTVSRAWSFQGSRPCVWNGRVYSVVGDELSTTSLASGREVWRWSGRFDGEGERALTPPAVANGRVYAGTREGRVLSWDADSGALRWSVDIGAAVAWQPVVQGGWVYAGGLGGRLVGFATGDPADDGWPMWGGGPGHNGDSARPPVTPSASARPAAPQSAS